MAKQAGSDNAAEATVPKSAQDAFAAILEAEEQPAKESPQNQDALEAEEEVVEEEVEEETSEGDEEENPEEESEEEDTEEEEEKETVDKIDIENIDIDQPLVYKDQELTLREALDGGLRQSDYSRKTAELAERRKGFEEHEQAVRQARAEYATKLEKLEAAIEAVQLPKELSKEEWDKLRRDNPSEYAARKADVADTKEKLQAVRAEREREQEKEQADLAEKYQEYLANERTELLGKLPEWKDEAVATKEQAELVAEAKSRGFSDDELALVDNHRIILLLRDAMKYRQLQGKKPLVRKKAKGAPVLKPGASKRPKAKVGKAQSARERLKKTGSVRDAAGFFLAGLEEEG